MKVKAAVLHDVKIPFEITELDLDGPGAGEVLIRYVAAGLCHSDLHLTEGDLTPRFPIVGGHEGAGIIEEVGPGVTKVKVGDHVVCSFIPNCGVCRYCATGHSSLCDMGATILGRIVPRRELPLPLRRDRLRADVHARHVRRVRDDLRALAR